MKETNTKSFLRPAFKSSVQWMRLLTQGSIKLRRDRIGEEYGIHHSLGGNYMVFRDTESRDGVQGAPAVLVVGFRLRFIGSNPLLHWLFQRICIISTPIWSGFPGFRTKLWMVDLKSENYLGIYEWAGKANALFYAEWLSNLLRKLSTKGSVWYKLEDKERIEEYLKPRRVAPDMEIQIHQILG